MSLSSKLLRSFTDTEHLAKTQFGHLQAGTGHPNSEVICTPEPRCPLNKLSPERTHDADSGGHPSPVQHLLGALVPHSEPDCDVTSLAEA